MSKEIDELKQACKAAICELNLARENECRWRAKIIEAQHLVKAKEKLLLKATAAEFVAAHKEWKAGKDIDFNLELRQFLSIRSKYASACLTAVNGDVVWEVKLAGKWVPFKSANAMLKALESAKKNHRKRKIAETACKKLVASTVDKMIGLLEATGDVSKSDLRDMLIDEIDQRKEIDE